ncbi:serine/threonine-protein kinase [Parachlamydia acanthamoebae]|uniref:serine/threonine-protein kinase n=1 Tax=Parachlamydia acanthamoebae TaxID=83552 RepID=UPI000A999853|nr:serine/threonine-protein kinase [Parachlamydia acanthamoebae]
MNLFGIYEAGYLMFKNTNCHQNTIRVPTMIECLFFNTIELKIELENRMKFFYLKTRDVVKFLEKNEIDVSPYASELELTHLFHQYILYPQEIKAKYSQHLISGKCLKGRIKLDIWKLDADDTGIKVANLFEWLFTNTVKLPLWDGEKMTTYTVKRDELIDNLKNHHVFVDWQISDEGLLHKIRSLAIQSLAGSKVDLIANALLGNFVHMSTVSSFTKEGKELKGGSEKELHFISSWAPTPILAIKIYEKKNEVSQNPILITVLQKNEPVSVYIDANELAQRLHLSLEKIEEYAKKGELEAYLSSKEDQLACLETVLANYKRLFKKQRLLGRTSLSPEKLMKMIHAFVKSMRVGDPPVLVAKKYIGLFRGKKLHIVDMTVKKTINQGAFIEALSVQNPVSGRPKVLKIIRTDFPEAELARHALKNEYDFLHKLHRGFRGKKIPGIQKAPHAISNLSQGKGKEGFLLTPQYIGDAFDNEIVPDEKAIQALYKLLKGFEYCVKKMNLGHGDIKPENMLIREVGQAYEIDLSDFGGARFLGKARGLGIFSVNYFPYNDLLLLREYDTGVPEDQELFDAYFRLKDVYALGSSMYFILSGGYEPYHLREYNRALDGPYNDEFIVRRKTFAPGGHPPPEANFNRELLLKNKIPLEIIDLIEKMVNLNPDERINIYEAAKIFDAYMDSKGKKLTLY